MQNLDCVYGFCCRASAALAAGNFLGAWIVGGRANEKGASCIRWIMGWSLHQPNEIAKKFGAQGRLRIWSGELEPSAKAVLPSVAGFIARPTSGGSSNLRWIASIINYQSRDLSLRRPPGGK